MTATSAIGCRKGIYTVDNVSLPSLWVTEQLVKCLPVLSEF